MVRDLAREEQIEVAVANFRFQAATLRHGAARVRAHLPQLAVRARHHLALLYDWLIRPLAALIGERRLVVVPHRSLHYVPFQALFDGKNYLIESSEICYAPSAAILSHCLRLPERPIQRADINCDGDDGDDDEKDDDDDECLVGGKQVVIIAAAGNSGTMTPEYPAAEEEVPGLMAVAATTETPSPHLRRAVPGSASPRLAMVS